MIFKILFINILHSIYKSVLVFLWFVLFLFCQYFILFCFFIKLVGINVFICYEIYSEGFVKVKIFIFFKKGVNEMVILEMKHFWFSITIDALLMIFVYTYMNILYFLYNICQSLMIMFLIITNIPIWIFTFCDFHFFVNGHLTNELCYPCFVFI